MRLQSIAALCGLLQLVAGLRPNVNANKQNLAKRQGHAELRSWGKYRKRDGTATGEQPAAYSPALTAQQIQAEGQRIADIVANIPTSAQAQIKSDAQQFIAQFTGLPDYVLSTVQNAVANIFNQKVATENVTQQYNQISSAINNTLQSIVSSLPAELTQTIGNITNMDDRSSLQSMQNCINTIVAMGGRQSTSDGTCLSDSGFDVTSLTAQFNAFGGLCRLF